MSFLTSSKDLTKIHYTMKKLAYLSIILFFTNLHHGFSQFYSIPDGCLKETENGPCLPNTLLTATPFLRINPDARSGGMGDAGIGLSPDANAMHFNASKLAFVENDMSISATYTPWLRQLGLQDVYLAYLSAYKKINDLQSLGFALRFFSLGDIAFTDLEGDGAGTGKPREFDLSFAYARKLGANFSVSIGAKYIYSNLAAGQQIAPGLDVSIGNAFATDLGLTYRLPIGLGAYNSDLSIGMAISNIGTKISYTNDVFGEYLPANLGIGGGWNIQIDDYKALTIAVDFNKLLVPTPVPFQDVDRYDISPANGTPDYKEKSSILAALTSFNDAAGGTSEELSEVSFSTGLEYCYDGQFLVRTGYFYEHPLKGDRQFLTLGLGLMYNVFSMDLSYLVPTNARRGPLDNTLRFGLHYNFGQEI